MIEAVLWKAKVVNWIPEVTVAAHPEADMATVEHAARLAIAEEARKHHTEDDHKESYAAQQSTAPLASLERVGTAYVDATFVAEAVAK